MMKKIILLISCIALGALMALNINGASMSSDIAVSDSIKVWSSSELSNLAETWVSGYINTKPDVHVNLQAHSSSFEHSKRNRIGDVGFLYQDEISKMGLENSKRIIVARDILVPIMNENNPYKEEIFDQGVSSERFSKMYSPSGINEWGSLINKDIKTPVILYKLKDAVANSNLEMFLKTDSKNQSGVALEAKDLIHEVQNNPYAIGFCRLSDITDFSSKEFKEKIIPIPIDINNNQKLDYIEKMYQNPDALIRGAWIGKYPHALYRNIYAVISDPTVKEAEKDFLEWIINDGQISNRALGFSELLAGERGSKLQSIYYNPVSNAKIESKPFLGNNTIFLLFAILIVGLIVYAFNSFISKLPVIDDVEKPVASNCFSEKSVIAPAGLFFNKHHTWTFMEKKGQVKIGVDDFLQHAIGTITKVKMKEVGTRIEKGEPLISITQNGKKLDINSPVTGIVQENNNKLIEAPSLINSDPYVDGWITAIQAEDWLREIKVFIMGDKYKAELKKEFSRLKDFLIFIFKREGNIDSLTVLQEGGELNDAPLKQLGPEAWEEFQIQFLNRAKS